MQTAMPGKDQTESVSLLLAGGLCLLPFLLPEHHLPLLSFQAEWLAAALGVAATLAALTRRGGVFLPPPVPARWLIAFALFLAAQALVGKPAYPQLPLMGALYVLYAALLVWLGAQLAASAGIERAAGVLAACLLIGALANAAAGMIQFYGRPALLEDIVAELRFDAGRARAYGNIAQTNLYANYLALGGAALLFLWQRGKLQLAFALALGALLAWACALADSRGTLLYALWFALLGLLAGRMHASPGARRLKLAAYGLAGAMLAAQFAIPWFNEILHLGPATQGAFERMAKVSSGQTEPRWELWQLAWRIFADAPVAGSSFGEFAGAAFSTGLPPDLAQFGGVVWTSPHNLPLQLLAETGALGAFLALGGVCTWCWQAGRRYFAAPEPALWWIIAAVGIELIHSMFEYPWWSADFLGVTALLMGLGTLPGAASKAASRLYRAGAAAVCATLALPLAALYRDYAWLGATHITGTSTTLGSAEDAARDAAIMRSLTHGPLAPTAELWILRGAPLDRSDLAGKLGMSQRLARTFPSYVVIARRTAFLAFDGQAAEARSLLARALRSFPHRCKETVLILEQARAADPGAIDPLLDLARSLNRANCI